MKIPHLKNLPKSGVEYYGPARHPNHRFYKYTYAVFHAGTPTEGTSLLKDTKHRMCLHDAHALISKLKQQNEGALVYGFRQYRRGSIFDIERILAKHPNLAIAPALEDDPDPSVEGHR